MRFSSKLFRLIVLSVLLVMCAPAYCSYQFLCLQPTPPNQEQALVLHMPAGVARRRGVAA